MIKMKNPYGNPNRKLNEGWQSGILNWEDAAEVKQENEDIKKARQFEADRQIIHEQREYDSPEAKAERMRQAGLNPDLIGVGDSVGEPVVNQSERVADLGLQDNVASAFGFLANAVGVASSAVGIATNVANLAKIRADTVGALRYADNMSASTTNINESIKALRLSNAHGVNQVLNSVIGFVGGERAAHKGELPFVPDYSDETLKSITGVEDEKLLRHFRGILEKMPENEFNDRYEQYLGRFYDSRNRRIESQFKYGSDVVKDIEDVVKNNAVALIMASMSHSESEVSQNYYNKDYYDNLSGEKMADYKQRTDENASYKDSVTSLKAKYDRARILTTLHTTLSKLDQGERLGYLEWDTFSQMFGSLDRPLIEYFFHSDSLAGLVRDCFNTIVGFSLDASLDAMNGIQSKVRELAEAIKKEFNSGGISSKVLPKLPEVDLNTFSDKLSGRPGFSKLVPLAPNKK